MPLRLESSETKLFAVLGALLLALVVLAGILKSSEEEEEQFPSSYSAARGGAKAAYELLQALGFKTEHWTGAPETLASMGKGHVLVLAEPVSVRPQEREAVRKFVAYGGRVLVTGRWATVLFPEVRPFAASIAKRSWRTYRALAPSDITRGAPSISMGESFVAISRPGEAMYGDSDTSAVVVRFSYGSGQVIWWADAVPLTNAGIRAPGNMELLLNSLGDRKLTILWDEYFHGASTPLWSYLKGTPVTWGLLQLGILLCAVLFTYSRRHGPIIVPPEASRLSPLEFVENLGYLYERARAAQITVDVALQRFRFQVMQSGLRSSASLPDIAGAVAARTGAVASEVLRTLQACERASVNPKLTNSEALALVQELHSYSVDLTLSGNKEQR